MWLCPLKPIMTIQQNRTVDIESNVIPTFSIFETGPTSIGTLQK